MIVHQGFRQHVGGGEGEFQRFFGQTFNKLPGSGEVEGTFSDRTAHNAGRLGAEAHPGFRPEICQLLARQVGEHIFQRRNEVFDHPVRFRVVGVKAGELAVGDHVDAGQLLGFDHDQDRIAQVWPGGDCTQPAGDRVAADDGGLDLRIAHLGSCLEGLIE